MANVAFRLFRVDPYIAKARNVKGLASSVGVSGSQNYITSWLTANQGHIFHDKTLLNVDCSAVINQRSAGAAANRGDPCLYIDGFTQISKDLIEVVAYKGSYGDLDTLVSARATTSNGVTNIRNDAATRRFLIRIGFSPSGNECYMAAQVRSRTQAGTDLFARISYETQLDAFQQPTTTNWYNWKAKAIMDPDRFKDAVGRAKVTKVSLVKTFRGSNGSHRGNKAELSVSDLTVVQQRGLLMRLRSWAVSAGQGITSRKSGVKDVAAFLPNKYAKASDWENAIITFEENEKETSIPADNINKLFIYPLGENATEDDMWNAANKAFKGISDANGWDIPRLI